MHLQFASFNISFSFLLPNTNAKIDITITGNHTLQKTWMGLMAQNFQVYCRDGISRGF